VHIDIDQSLEGMLSGSSCLLTAAVVGVRGRGRRLQPNFLNALEIVSLINALMRDKMNYITAHE
jgi:hypothetical protein